LCPHTPEDYSPAEEVRKLRAKQKEEAVDGANKQSAG
jgi:hypothetical protein